MRAGGTVRKVKKPMTLNTKVKRNVLLQEKNTESYSMSSCDILYTAEAELIKKKSEPNCDCTNCTKPSTTDD